MHLKLPATILFIGLVSLCAFSSAFADCSAESPPDTGASAKTNKQASLFLENDFFSTHLGLGDSDKWYTNGVKFTYTYDEDTAMLPTATMRNAVERLAKAVHIDDFCQARYGVAFGQLMFTPQDTTIAAPQPNDRYYGGWLYMGGVIQERSDKKTVTAEFDVGVTGPYSGAEWAQKEIHRLFNYDAPQGWHNQIKTEPGLQFNYNSITRLEGNSHFDVSGYWGAVVGTIFDNAKVGMILRLGQLSDNVPASVIESPVIGGDLQTHGWYFLAKGEVEGVLHNTFIDGSLFRSDPFANNTETKPVVGQVTVGFVKEGLFDEPVKLSFLLSRRTQEFTSPTVGAGQLFTFGTVNVEFPI
ncbi:MAG TPA: lipid A deacylase LpxR family protein [Methylophilaceae bacterium]